MTNAIYFEQIWLLYNDNSVWTIFSLLAGFKFKIVWSSSTLVAGLFHRTLLQAFLLIHWLVLSFFYFFQNLQLLELLLFVDPILLHIIEKLMIEMKPLLCSFLNVADWNKVTSFLIGGSEVAFIIKVIW